jgi:nitroreductase
MLNRRSVRKYTGEPVTEDKIKLILQAGLSSATSKNRKPWEFVVVQEKETLKALVECRAGAAKMLENAGCAIVVFANIDVTPDVWVEDCSIAMSNMHLMTDALGLGSCWIQGRCREAENGQTTEAFCRELLGVPENHALLAILSIGVPAEHASGYTVEDLKEEKIHWEKF